METIVQIEIIIILIHLGKRWLLFKDLRVHRDPKVLAENAALWDHRD